MKRSHEEVADRRKLLISILQELEVSNVKTLSRKLNVSEMTVRRDCSVLSEMGQIRQSFGKVELLPLDDSQLVASEPIEHIKKCLAKEAASYVDDRDTVFINTSSTAVQALAYLKDKAISLLTNNTTVIGMEHNPKSAIILSGGEIRYPKQALSGDIAMESFSAARSDISIIGCSGLALSTGISTSVMHEARINSKIIENSGKLVVVADYRKIGKSSNFTIGEISDIDTLITDTFADQACLAAIEKQGVRVIQVPT